MRDLLTHREQDSKPGFLWHYAVDSLATIKMPLMQNLHCWIKWMYTPKKPFFLWKIFGKKIRKYTLITPAPLKRCCLVADLSGNRTYCLEKRCHLKQKFPSYHWACTGSLFCMNATGLHCLRHCGFSGKSRSGLCVQRFALLLQPEIVQRLAGKVLKIPSRHLPQHRGQTAYVLIRWNVPASDIVPTEYDSLFRQSLIHGKGTDEGLPLWEVYRVMLACLAP